MTGGINPTLMVSVVDSTIYNSGLGNVETDKGSIVSTIPESTTSKTKALNQSKTKLVKSSSNKKVTASKTGDNNNSVFYLVFLLVSVLGISYIVYKRRIK
ncbi:MAG: LPXTG cell wall anchor domain-containing protein [Lachnospiraceae bacterium]|jgi:LPXTG-motif cell wall-anchored protein|nr:LPXTG cell wall anchor domain-containing protein [Lachnospiraceae bacterium]